MVFKNHCARCDKIIEKTFNENYVEYCKECMPIYKEFKKQEAKRWEEFLKGKNDRRT